MSEDRSDFIQYLMSIDTPTLANAIELLNVRPRREGFTPLGLHSLFPEFGRMCGYAVTAEVETVTESGAFRLDTFVELYRLVEQSPKPAIIVLQETGGFGDYAAHCGEVMASFFTRLGATGLVSDCGVRDLPEVRRLGFHYFARGAVASHANFRIVRCGGPVQVLGMPVAPMSIVHGDENGLITVPDGVQDRLRACVDQVRERERRVLDFVQSEHFDLARFQEMVAE